MQMIIISDIFCHLMQDHMRGCLLLFAVFVSLVSAVSSALPLSFLGDVADMSPLECLDRQCAALGGNCAEKCVGIPESAACMARCSMLLDSCYKSRCFLTIRKVMSAQAGCCAQNRFGCLWDDNLGCIDGLRRDCGVNKGFNESFRSCVDANLTDVRGNATLNLSSLSLPDLDSSGACRDTSQCEAGGVCFMGACVPVSLITPDYRAMVECLDDADCPSSTAGRYVCLDSRCVMRPPGFCRRQSDCQDGWSCLDLSCVAPISRPVVEAPPMIEPAVAILQQWARSRPGIVARVVAVSGSPLAGSTPTELSIGGFFSVGDDVVVPQGMAVELSLAEGSRAMLGPGCQVALRSFKAGGSSISVGFSLLSGAVVFDVSPLKEVERDFQVQVASHLMRLDEGVSHVVAYREGSIRLAALDEGASLDGVRVGPGQYLLMDPSGAVRSVSNLTSQEAGSIRQAAQSPVVAAPPPYEGGSFIERYGMISLLILVVFMLALWVFWKRRPKRAAGAPSSKGGIVLPGKKFEFEQEPPKLL